MATIVTRAGKGAPLTHVEVDANFTNLDTDKLESSDVAAVAISGAYSDLSGTPTLATVATTGAYSDLSGLPTLGTAAAADATAFVAQTSATGAALIPTGTEAQRPSPAAGQLRFNTDEGSFEGYDGAEWGAIGGGGGAINDLFYENAQTVAASYTIPATRNAMTTGPITINDGVTVTVSDGARWVVL